MPSEDIDQPGWMLVLSCSVSVDEDRLCNVHDVMHLAFEPPHNKTNKLTVRPATTQISLGVRQSDQSSLCAHWVAKDPSFLHADSEDSDQTGRMPRLI